MINREELDKIILSNNTDNWWKPDLFVKNTLDLLPTELEILSNPPEEESNYNCFVFAFGLHNEKAFINETKGFVYDPFVSKLISLGELVKTQEPKDGDYVVYQDMENYPDLLTHIGVLEGDKVISKWAWGPLIRHKLWDVPESYGHDIFYLKAISPDEARNLYNQYKEFNVKPV